MTETLLLRFTKPFAIKPGTAQIVAKPSCSKTRWDAFCTAWFFAPILGSLIGLALAVLLFPISAHLCIAAAMLFFAPYLGLKTYLLFGAPLFALHLRILGSNPWTLAITGLIAHFASVDFLYFHAALSETNVRHVENVVEIGCFVAPVWGFLLGYLYRRFTQ